MEAIKDLIFGDPVYDRRGRVVRRNFGIKNALVIILIVYGLYSLRGKMGIKSGRRKLGGILERGSGPPDNFGDNRTVHHTDNWLVKKWNAKFKKKSGIAAVFLVAVIVLGVLGAFIYFNFFF